MTAGRLVVALDAAGPAHQEVAGDVVVLDAAGEEDPHRVRVACEVEPVGRRIHLRAQVTAGVRSRCHRCLGEFERAVEASFEVLVQRGGPAAGGEDDVIVVPESAVEYDLLPRVREALILEEPIQLVCRPDCRGLCPRCGQDLNRGDCGCAPADDRRWDALRALRDTLER